MSLPKREENEKKVPTSSIKSKGVFRNKKQEKNVSINNFKIHKEKTNKVLIFVGKITEDSFPIGERFLARGTAVQESGLGHASPVGVHPNPSREPKVWDDRYGS